VSLAVSDTQTTSPATAAGQKLARRILSAVVAALVIGISAIIGWASEFAGPMPALSGPNAFFYDLAVATLGDSSDRNPWPHTLVLLLDEESLAREPWSQTPRALHQPHLGNLTRSLIDMGARKVAFDLVVAMDPAQLAIPSAALKDYDAPLRSVLAEYPSRIVLGAYPTVGPAETYADLVGPSGVGVVDLQAEADGIIRSVATRVRTPSGAVEPAFAELVAAPPDGDVSIRPQSRVLLFPPVPLTRVPSMNVATFERCSQTTLGLRVLASAIRGRNVLIGAAVAGEDVRRGPDRFMVQQPLSPPANECRPTTLMPSTSGRNIVPGVIVQAAAVENAMSERNPELADPLVRAGSSGAVAALGVLLFAVGGRRLVRLPVQRPRLFATSLGAFAGVSALTLALGLSFFVLQLVALAVFGLWLPLGYTLVFVAAAGFLGIMTIAVRRDLALADLRTAFGRYLPPPVVAAALDSRDAFDGEERMVSVLIADLRGFTPFCGTHRDQPAQIIRALNEKFASAQEILDRYEACLDKFDGDAVIAFWNGVGDQTDHAARALAAAIELVERDRIAVATGHAPLAFKVAVATGIAFVGSYGSRQKRNFSAIGEPMNLAARLESVCNEFETDILLARETVDQALRVGTQRDDIRAILESHRFVELGMTELKGFDGSVPVITVVRDPEVTTRQR
jgi:class 3 adenylate cyclase/CHASE2 domain-containing sensor protein